MTNSLRFSSKLKIAATIASIFAHAALASQCLAAESLEKLLQAGLFEEVGRQNLGKAREQYEAVLTEYRKEKKIAAAAQLQLAKAFQKEGRTNEAIAHFRAVISEFAENKEIARAARESLIALKAEPSGPAANEENEGEKEIARLSKLLKESPDLINAKSANAMTLLQGAASAKQLEVAEFLIKRGAQVNVPVDDAKASPLGMAIINTQIQMVDLLIKSGADVNAQGAFFRKTPLWLAADTGNLEITSLLLQAGADPNGNEVFRPLHKAAEKGFKAIAAELLKFKAELNGKDSTHSTPLHIATQHGHSAMIEFFLDSGADLEARNQRNDTPLLTAALYLQADAIRTLMKKGADANAIGWQGNSVLHMPFYSFQGQNRESPAEVLQAVIGKTKQIQHRNDQGLSPLWLAVYASGSYSKNPAYAGVEILLNAGADPNERFLPVFLGLGDPFQSNPEIHPPRSRTYDLIVSGQTPLFEGYTFWGSDLANLLLTHGANPKLKSLTGETALERLVNRQTLPDKESIQLFLSKGGDVNEPFSNGLTAWDNLQERVKQNAQLPQSAQTALTLSALAEVLDFLRASGAREGFARPDGISLQESGKPMRTLFSKERPNETPPSLLEALQQTLRHIPELNWTNIVVMPGGQKDRSREIDFSEFLRKGDCSELNLQLNWGDVIALPKDPLQRNEWIGQPNYVHDAFTNCLAKRLVVTVDGKTERISIMPSWSKADTRSAAPATAKFGWRFHEFNPALGMIRFSGLPLWKLQPRKITVNRRSNGEAKLLNIETKANAPWQEFRVQDGDEIVISTNHDEAQ
jgi:ankyrin repeat protein